MTEKEFMKYTKRYKDFLRRNGHSSTFIAMIIYHLEDWFYFNKEKK